MTRILHGWGLILPAALPVLVFVGWMAWTLVMLDGSARRFRRTYWWVTALLLVLGAGYLGWFAGDPAFSPNPLPEQGVPQ